MDESTRPQAVTVTAVIEHAQFWLTTAGQAHPASDGLIPESASDRIASNRIAVAVPTVEQWADVEVRMTLHSSRPGLVGAHFLGEATLDVIDGGLRCIDFHSRPLPCLALPDMSRCTVDVWRRLRANETEAYEVCVFPGEEGQGTPEMLDA